MRRHAQTPALVTAPASQLLTLEDVKLHCRVETSEDDTLLQGLIGAATAHLDGWGGILGRCLLTQTWEQRFDQFPVNGKIMLPLLPVQSVVVTYLDQTDAEATLPAGVYHVTARGAGAFVELDEAETWPTTADRPDAVRVRMVCGYGTAEAVPHAIRQAARMLVGHWYENREAVVIGTTTATVPLAVSHLLAPYRRVGI